MTLTTRAVKPRELTDDELAIWSRIQQQTPMLESPYFRPAFTQAVAEVRDDVEVAVLEQNRRAVGFLPFQRVRSRIAKPVGGRLSDFHGAIVEPDVEWNVETVLRDCEITCWDFDHLVEAQPAFDGHRFGWDASPYIDLSQGFDAYAAGRRRAGSKRIKQTRRKARKLERDFGSVRFVPHANDPEVLETLLEWKSEQYRRSHLTDLFSIRWKRELLERIVNCQNEDFAGMLSVLYAGDRIAAIDFSMRSFGVLHSWFPAYDREFARYSPGHVLLLETAKAAESLGIRRIHLGKGEESYKNSFADDCVEVAVGSVDLNPARRMVKQTWHRAREWARRTALRSALRRPARFVRRALDQVSM